MGEMTIVVHSEAEVYFTMQVSEVERAAIERFIDEYGTASSGVELAAVIDTV